MRVIVDGNGMNMVLCFGTLENVSPISEQCHLCFCLDPSRWIPIPRRWKYPHLKNEKPESKEVN